MGYHRIPCRRRRRRLMMIPMMFVIHLVFPLVYEILEPHVSCYDQTSRFHLVTVEVVVPVVDSCCWSFGFLYRPFVWYLLLLSRVDFDWD